MAWKSGTRGAAGRVRELAFELTRVGSHPQPRRSVACYLHEVAERLEADGGLAVLVAELEAQWAEHGEEDLSAACLLVRMVRDRRHAAQALVDLKTSPPADATELDRIESACAALTRAVRVMPGPAAAVVAIRAAVLRLRKGQPTTVTREEAGAYLVDLAERFEHGYGEAYLTDRSVDAVVSALEGACAALAELRPRSAAAIREALKRIRRVV